MYPAITTVAKETKQAQSLKVSESQTIHIPARTAVFLNTVAIHLNKEYWGDDALAWRPDRWFVSNPETSATTLLQPKRGWFLPWSDGARQCPGRKVCLSF